MTKVTCEHSGIEFKTKDMAEQVSSSMVAILISAHNKLEDQLTELREELDAIKRTMSIETDETAPIAKTCFVCPCCDNMMDIVVTAVTTD